MFHRVVGAEITWFPTQVLQHIIGPTRGCKVSRKKWKEVSLDLASYGTVVLSPDRARAN